MRGKNRVFVYSLRVQSSRFILIKIKLLFSARHLKTSFLLNIMLLLKNKYSEGLQMELWTIWYDLVNSLRDSCSRERTFFWLTIILIGFTIKSDFLGVTSLARGAGLLPNYYTCLLNFFSSSAIDLDKLLDLWVKLVFDKFDGAVKLNGRYLLVADGIKIGKEGKKMPAVKWLHQDSASNSKAEHIMGHSLQAIAVLVKGVKYYFAVPLTAKVHEGIRYHCHDKRTLLDKLFETLLDLNLSESYSSR